MQNFSIKTKIYFGQNSLEHLSEIKCKKAFIVTDPFMIKSGAVEKITQQLLKGNILFDIFSEIVPDPPIETIVKGIEIMNSCKPDVVIALGGGSAIDAAKAICSFDNKIQNLITSNSGMNSNVINPIFIAIPTTSGTGSEVTSFSVITDKEKNIKYPLVSDELLPDEAILDAELVKTVPNFITADTGIDVLTHALEAYVSIKASDYTDALAEKSIKLVFQNLAKAYKDGFDENAREKLHNASCIAGIAFNNASLGLNHGMAHIIGGRFHIPHGRANAIILPYIIEYNADLKSFTSNDYSEAAIKYAEISKLLGLSSSTPRQGVKSLIIAIKNLLRNLNLPANLKEAGIKEEDFKYNLKEISEIALKDRCTETNPKKPSINDIESLFEEAYYGK